MWYRAARGFVITSMAASSGLTVALITAMAAGLRPISALDLALCGGLLFGFLNAVGDLVETEEPVDHDEDDLAPAAPVLHILRQKGEHDGLDPDTNRLEGLEAFRSER